MWNYKISVLRENNMYNIFDYNESFDSVTRMILLKINSN